MIRAARICLFLFVAALVALGFLSAAADAGHCHRRVQAVAVHHQAYVQPIVQNVFYSVGENIRFESAVQKAVREELQQWRSLETGKPVAPAEAPPQQNSGSLLNAKCAKCHDEFRDAQSISCETYKRFDQMLMQTHNGLKDGNLVPAKMQTGLQGLSEVDALNIKAEMLGLIEKAPVEDEPGVLK
jgi:hypothetical protein